PRPPPRPAPARTAPPTCPVPRTTAPPAPAPRPRWERRPAREWRCGGRVGPRRAEWDRGASWHLSGVDRWLPETPAERSHDGVKAGAPLPRPRPPGSLPPAHSCRPGPHATPAARRRERRRPPGPRAYTPRQGPAPGDRPWRSEEHTSELQSRENLV